MMDAVVVFVCVRLMTYDFAIKRMKNQHKTTMNLVPKMGTSKRFLFPRAFLNALNEEHNRTRVRGVAF